MKDVYEKAKEAAEALPCYPAFECPHEAQSYCDNQLHAAVDAVLDEAAKVARENALSPCVQADDGYKAARTAACVMVAKAIEALKSKRGGA